METSRTVTITGDRRQPEWMGGERGWWGEVQSTQGWGERGDTQGGLSFSPRLDRGSSCRESVRPKKLQE